LTQVCLHLIVLCVGISHMRLIRYIQLLKKEYKLIIS